MVVSKPRAAHGLPTATVVEGDCIATVHTAWDLPFAPTVMTTTESVNAHEPQVSMTDELLTRDVEALNSRTSLPQQSIWLSHCLLYTSPSPRDVEETRMPSSA